MLSMSTKYISNSSEEKNCKIIRGNDLQSNKTLGVVISHIIKSNSYVLVVLGIETLAVYNSKNWLELPYRPPLNLRSSCLGLDHQGPVSNQEILAQQ